MNGKNEIKNLNITGKDIDFKNSMRKIYGESLQIDNSQNTILILSRVHDTEINYIGPLLARKNINYIRIDADYFLEDLKVTFCLETGQPSLKINYKDEEIDFSSIKLIWFRHFNEEAFKFDSDDKITNLYILQEWQSFLNYLYSLNPEKWINNPNSVRNSTKIKQLVLASKVGFRVLDTLVTNDSSSLKDFKQQRELFCKANFHHFVEYPTGFLNSIYGRKFKNEDYDLLNTLSASPVIFQELSKNLTEVRVTTFGDYCFGAIYNNKENEDWHLDDMNKVELSEISVPKIIKDKCAAMLEALGLQYGAFDFFHDEDENKWTFIEVNTIGDWKWLENKTGQEISIDFVNYINKLLNGDENYEN